MDTLIDALERNAVEHPDALAFRFLESGDADGPCSTYSNAELNARVRGVASEIARSLQPGARVLLLYPPGLEFIVGFFGCLAAGAIAVPAFPPDPSGLERGLRRLRAVVADCEASAVLCTSEVSALAEAILPLAPELASLRWIASDRIAPEAGASRSCIDPSSVAFLQYTSGSTGTPKGVVVRHDNLMHNVAVINACMEMSAPQCVDWLPMYHDMGLIGTILAPISGCYPATLMSPIAFLQRPARWLEAITAFRGTASAAPNFAYELCIRRVTAEERARLDLSTVATLFNGSEPVRAETLERFTEAFASCGLRREALRPVYGLAESTLIVTGERSLAPFVTIHVDAEALAAGRAVVVSPDSPRARALVGCGRTFLGQRIECVDPVTRRRVEHGTVGEIWIAGPSVAAAYWGLTEASARDFNAHIADDDEGPFLRSGDLGFVHDGELFVVGRAKDLIIVRGRNLYPQDLERAAEQAHKAVRPGCAAAFSVDHEQGEAMVIVAEVDERRVSDPAAVIAAIREAVSNEAEMPPYAVALLRARTMPKTTSGKVQRRACREEFLTGTLSLFTDVAIAAGEPALPEIAPGSLARELSSATSEEREARLRQAVNRKIAARVGIEPNAISSDQSLSEIGLDSLGRVDVGIALSRALALELPPSFAFQHHTPRALATALDDAWAHRSDRTREATPTVSTSYRATANQALIWRLKQHAPAAYMHVFALRITGPMEPEQVRRALQNIVDQHAIWRTTFHFEDGVVRAREHARMAVEVAVEHGEHQSEHDLSSRIETETARPIDVSRGPLLRGTLVLRKAEEAVLLLAFDHIAYDSAFLVNTIRELLFRLGGRTEQAAITAAHYQGSLSSYAAWEHALLESTRGDDLRSFWRATLPSPSVQPLRLSVPHDRDPGAPRSYDCASVTSSLDRPSVERLEQLARTVGVTLNTVLLTAYQAVLHAHTQAATVVVGTATLNRVRSDHRDVQGPLFNHVPMVARFDDETRLFVDLLTDGQRAAGEALSHQDLPFADIAASFGADHNEVGNAVFTLPAMWAFYRTEHLLGARSDDPLVALLDRRAVTMSRLTFEFLPVRSGKSATDYFLFATEHRGVVQFDLWYGSDRIDRTRAAHLLDDVIAVLSEIATDPTRQIRALLTAALDRTQREGRLP